MGRNRGKADNTSGEKNNSLPEDSNNLQSKIVNRNETDVNENNTVVSGLSALDINVDQGANEKSYHKEDVVTSAAEASGSSSRPRRKCNAVSSYCLPRSPSPDDQPSSSAKKMKIKKPKVENRNIGDDDVDNLTRDTNSTNHSFDDKSHDENPESNLKESASSALALDKLKFDVTVDPNIVDRYTDSGFTAGGSTPESPETQRQRIDIISRQCRLHPSNKKYNQGPVENPPLISPGIMVGYTPGGQRHEVDLNFDRPTWFNSEYARMQWDCATRVNVSRMFHELETGTFLADGLDPNIERKYFAQQEMASKQATEHFQEICYASSSHANGQSTAPDLTEEDSERLRLLETEREMIELNQYASVRFQDFTGEIVRKLRNALDLTLTPLMIKKNPMILDTLERLATQCIHIEVVVAARALLDKIRGLFQVPENREFREFFAEEFEKLKEKTKNMSGLDIVTMTEEPPDDEEDTESTAYTCRCSHAVPVNGQSEGEPDLSEPEDEWVSVENEDDWVDPLLDSDNASHVSSVGSNMNVSDVSASDDDEDDNDWTYDDESDPLSNYSYSDEEFEAQIDDFLGTLVSGMLINGGYTFTVTFSYFEYI